MEGAVDPIKAVNDQIKALQEGTLALEEGVFEGISLPKEFDQTLQDLEMFPEQDDAEEEEDEDEGTGGENLSSAPQTSLKTLKELMADAEKAGIPAPTEAQKKRSFPLEPLLSDKWGFVEEDNAEEEREDTGDPKEPSKDDAGLIEEVIPRTQYSKGWEEQVTEPLELETLLERLSALGVSLDKKEVGVLRRKTKTMQGLSVRDGMMFIEGLRSASTLAESKITEHLEGFKKALEMQKSHVRNLEKSVSAVKMSEKNYLELLETLGAEKRTIQERIEQQIKEAVEQEKKKLLAWKTEKERELLEELKIKRERVLSSFAKTVSESPASSPKASTRKGAASTAMAGEKLSKAKEKAPKDTVTSLSFKSSFDISASEELASLSEYLSRPISKLLEHYEMSLDEMDEALSGFPKTVPGWIAKYKQPLNAADAVHRHIMSLGSESG